VPAVCVVQPVPLYGAVPPEAVTQILVVPPLHGIGLGVAVTEAVSAVGWVTVIDVADVQPLASVTIKL
jgi:hypothetical protein